MIRRSLVKRTSGTRANGIPKESSTWLITRVLVGLAPIPMTTSAGIIVTPRRTTIGTERRRKPCITTWPASVPTAELESPEKSSESAKSVPALAPSSGFSVSPATWRSPISPVTPLP